MGEAGSSQVLILTLAVLGITLIMMSTIRRARKASVRQGSYVQELRKTAQEDRICRDAGQIMVQLDEWARQIHGQLDLRIARLEALIADADGRIDELARLIRRSEGQATIDVTLQEEHPSPQPTSSAEQVHATVYRLADGGLSAIDIATQVGKTTGEVELILALRKARRGASPPAANPYTLQGV
jgi:hypothetical protein